MTDEKSKPFLRVGGIYLTADFVAKSAVMITGTRMLPDNPASTQRVFSDAEGNTYYFDGVPTNEKNPALIQEIPSGTEWNNRGPILPGRDLFDWPSPDKPFELEEGKTYLSQGGERFHVYGPSSESGETFYGVKLDGKGGAADLELHKWWSNGIYRKLTGSGDGARNLVKEDESKSSFKLEVGKVYRSQSGVQYHIEGRDRPTGYDPNVSLNPWVYFGVIYFNNETMNGRTFRWTEDGQCTYTGGRAVISSSYHNLIAKVDSEDLSKPPVETKENASPSTPSSDLLDFETKVREIESFITQNGGFDIACPEWDGIVNHWRSVYFLPSADVVLRVGGRYKSESGIYQIDRIELDEDFKCTVASGSFIDESGKALFAIAKWDRTGKAINLGKGYEHITAYDLTEEVPLDK